MSIPISKYTRIISGVGGTVGGGGTEGSAPENVSLPFVIGQFKVGEPLTANVGSWSESPTSFAVRWLINEIQSGVGFEYTPNGDEAGASVVIGVTANNGYASDEVLSLVQGPIIPADGLVLTGVPPLAGVEGSAYSAQFGAVGGVAPYTFELASGAFPTGTTLNASTGLLSGTLSADGAFTFSVKATDSEDEEATGGPWTVNITDAAAPPSWSVPPSITGNAYVGSALVANDGTVVNGTVTGRQWQLNGVDVVGETGTTFTPARGDIGDVASLVVFASGPGGESDLESPNTAPIVGVPLAPTIGTAVGGNASATVAATANPDDGGATVDKFRATPYIAGVAGTPVESLTLPVGVPDLINGTLYVFTTQSHNVAGWSAESAQSNAVTPEAGGTITPEPAMASLLLAATELTSSAEITNNGDGTWTGTASTAGNARLADATTLAGLPANTDTYMALEWRGGDGVAVCFAGSNTQSWTGGRWMYLQATGVYWRDAGTNTKIKDIDAIGSRYRLIRLGTALTIQEEDSATGDWATIYTFAAVIGTGSLFVVCRTTTGIIKPLQGYGIAKASQSQWIDPSFPVLADGSVAVSAAGEAGECIVTRVTANRRRGATSVLALIPPPDDHNRAAVIVLLDGTILTGYTGHNVTNYFTRKGNTPSRLDWSPELTVSTSPNTISYAQMYRRPTQARVFRMHRSGGASSGGWNMLYTDNAGTAWSGTKRLANLTYQLGRMAPDGKTVWVHAYSHPLAQTPNNIYLFKMDLETGDIMHPDGTVLANYLTGSGNPLITPAQMLLVVAADGAPATTRLCEVFEDGTTRGACVIRFNKDAVDTSGNMVVCRWNGANNAYSESIVRSAGPAFAPENAYFGAFCFGATMDTVYTAYQSATGVYAIRAYTWDSGTSTWIAGPIIRQITGIISRPRYQDGYLYWSELKSYTGTPSFAFAGNFVWRQMA